MIVTRFINQQIANAKNWHMKIDKTLAFDSPLTLIGCFVFVAYFPFSLEKQTVTIKFMNKMFNSQLLLNVSKLEFSRTLDSK